MNLTGSLTGMLSASGAALTGAPCGQINAAVIGAMAREEHCLMKISS
ncbi:MAG: hypothetical protein J7479_18830 [Roseiflexus sp.]|jgi:hypothetical protein|nr:hypothetical protein [Roseiflexus sp.]